MNFLVGIIFTALALLAFALLSLWGLCYKLNDYDDSKK